MANERIGRMDSYGFAAETTRMTAQAAPDCWYPRLSGVIEDKQEKDIVEAAVGHIGKVNYGRNVKSWSEGTFEGLITDIDFGWILGALFGAYPSPAAVGGETLVVDHIFPVTNTNLHQSLTVFKREGSIGTRKFAGCCIESLSISYQKDQVLRFSMDVKGKPGATDTDTVTITSNNIFTPSNFTFKTAATAITTALTQTALTAASEVVVESCDITFEKNLSLHWNDGVPYIILNGPMGITGTVTLLHTDSTYLDLDAGTTNKALRFELVNSTTIGSASNPTLTLDVISAIIKDYEKKEELSEAATQTFGFEAQYSPECAELAVATLRNTRDAGYSDTSSTSPSISPSPSS